MYDEQSFFDQVDRNILGFVDRLLEAVRIPRYCPASTFNLVPTHTLDQTVFSISGDAAHEQDVKRMQTWLTDELKSLGVSIDVSPDEVPSLVLGRINGVGGSTKTVLVYGHYDVQPVSDVFSSSQVLY